MLSAAPHRIPRTLWLAVPVPCLPRPAPTCTPASAAQAMSPLAAGTTTATRHGCSESPYTHTWQCVREQGGWRSRGADGKRQGRGQPEWWQTCNEPRASGCE